MTKLKQMGFLCLFAMIASSCVTEIKSPTPPKTETFEIASPSATETPKPNAESPASVLPSPSPGPDKDQLKRQIESLTTRLEALERRRISCLGGISVKGSENRWSPWSSCPQGYTVSGLQRIDLLGSHTNPIAHINDFQCTEQGCRAWCIGSDCTVEARCCSLSN